MSRIRTIHPDFVDSVSMHHCSDSAQLLFAKMWTVADDDGRLIGDAQWLASRIYPRRPDRAPEVPAYLDELELQGCIQRYVVNDEEYIQVVNWKKRQRISHPTRSKLPAPPNFRKVSGAIPEQVDNLLDDNEKEANSGIVPEPMDIPRTADGKVDVSPEWVTEVLATALVEGKARGANDIVLRSAQMLGRTIGMFADGRFKPAAPSRPGDNRSGRPAGDDYGGPTLGELHGMVKEPAEADGR